MRSVLLMACLFTSLTAKAQSFILNQFFQPSISLNTEYTYDYASTADRWSMGRINANVIVPIKSRLGVKMDFSKIFSIKKLSDVKDAAKVKAYQIFWTFRPQAIYLHYQPQNLNPSPFRQEHHLAYGLQTGITGLHLIKKMRILFYTVNVGVQEDLGSFRQVHPYGSAILGVVNFNKLMYYWYYGVSLSYGEGQPWRVLPIPFFGVDLHLADKLWWNITLPIQTRFEWKFNRYAKADLVASLATYGWGFESQPLLTHPESTRLYSAGFQFRTGAAINLKNKRGTKFYLEAGYIPFRSFGFSGEGSTLFANPQLQPSPYVALSFFYGFKRSLLGNTVESFLNF